MLQALTYACLQVLVNNTLTCVIANNKNSKSYWDSGDRGSEAISCQHGGGHLPRHASVNETIRCALVSAFQVVYQLFLNLLGSVVIMVNDLMSLDSLEERFTPLWDFTCSDTLGPSHLATSVCGAGRLADCSGAHKRRRYSPLSFSPYV